LKLWEGKSVRAVLLWAIVAYRIEKKDVISYFIFWWLAKTLIAHVYATSTSTI